MEPDDPRLVVEAPVRNALASLAVRGLLVVGAVLAAVLCPCLPGLHRASDAIAIAVTSLLLAYGLLVHLGRRVAARRRPIPSEEALAAAWDHAREVDADDALLALLVVGWVPVALAVALFVMIWPHFNDPNPQLRGAWAVLGMPPIVVAWMVATATWLSRCREDLAGAADESTRRFRSYWANVGH